MDLTLPQNLIFQPEKRGLQGSWHDYLLHHSALGQGRLSMDWLTTLLCKLFMEFYYMEPRVSSTRYLSHSTETFTLLTPLKVLQAAGAHRNLTYPEPLPEHSWTMADSLTTDLSCCPKQDWCRQAGCWEQSLSCVTASELCGNWAG